MGFDVFFGFVGIFVGWIIFGDDFCEFLFFELVILGFGSWNGLLVRSGSLHCFGVSWNLGGVYCGFLGSGSCCWMIGDFGADVVFTGVWWLSDQLLVWV